MTPSFSSFSVKGNPTNSANLFRLKTISSLRSSYFKNNTLSGSLSSSPACSSKRVRDSEHRDTCSRNIHQSMTQVSCCLKLCFE
uniref:Uncharacterized protein n=1 Tax=Salix viminalis TaxID=40686 RepID=A0A6N2M553_SALVM